jgi:hypothetical protein
MSDTSLETLLKLDVKCVHSCLVGLDEYNWGELSSSRRASLRSVESEHLRVRRVS